MIEKNCLKKVLHIEIKYCTLSPKRLYILTWLKYNNDYPEVTLVGTLELS